QVLCDNDVSADSGRPRPAYQQLLADIEAGLVDAVIVWALDRLHRRPAELERFFEVCDRAGVTRLASVAGDVDLGTNDGRFHARILGAVAKKENDDRRRRIQRAALQAAEQGRISGGGPPPRAWSPPRPSWPVRLSLGSWPASPCEASPPTGTPARSARRPGASGAPRTPSACSTR